jgi:hypothetical protein
MAIIYSYPQPAINTGMLLVGSNTNETGNPTINIGVGALAEFVLAYFNNNGTPNTHAMFITNTTIGDSYINQTAPGAASASLYSNENHEMNKYLVCKDNVYIGDGIPAVGKVIINAQDINITGTNWTLTTTTSQSYYGIEGHYGTEDHYGQVTFHNDVDFGDLTTTNVDDINMWSKLRVYGQLLDSNLGSPGGAGQILSSTGTGVDWIDPLPSGLEYQGVWNANTNIPPLASGVGTPGHYYIVSEDGATNLDGNNTWEIGDWAIFSSTNVWQEIDNQNIFSGAGTANTMTKFTGPTSLGDSQTTDDGTNIDMTAAGQLDLGGTPIVLTAGGPGIVTGSPATFNSIVNLNNQTTITGSLTDGFVSSGAAGQVLSSTGAGNVQWINGSAVVGAITGGGTVDYVPRWTPSGTALGNSQIQDDATDIDINTVGSTSIVAGGGGAGEVALTAVDNINITSNTDSVYIKTLGTDVADRIELRAYDPVGFDQKFQLYTDTGVSADVSEFSITTKGTGTGMNFITLANDIVLQSAAAIKMLGSSFAVTSGPWVFNNASVQFNEPIVDSIGSTGAGGDILKNDGTGKVTWGAPSFVQEAKIYATAPITITNAELLNIAAVPKILIPALGANLAIVVQSITLTKPVNVSYDFPENLYAAEAANVGVPTAKQAILDNNTANLATLLYTTLPAIASGSWVDGGYRYGLTLAGNNDLVMTEDGLNATVGTGDFTVVVYYRKLDLTTMEYLTT